MNNKQEKPLVIIPTYNEASNISELINQIFNELPQTEILIVDDSSPDGTGDIIDQISSVNPRVHCLHRDRKLGLGTAYIAGFQWALQGDYTHCFEMDADFSHDPKDLPRLLAATKNFDFAIGSRFYAGKISIVNWPLSRLILSLMTSIYVRIVTGLKLWDSTTGFKCFRREVLENLPLENIKSEGYSFQIDLNVRATRLGYRVGEIPITFIDRTKCGSKMSKKIIFEAIWRVWQLRFTSRHQQKRRNHPKQQ